MKLVIIGSGGHAGVVIDAVRNLGTWDIVGLYDETVGPGGICQGYRLIGRPDFRDDYFYHVAIGDNAVRERLSKIPRLKWENVFHRHSVQPKEIPCCGPWGSFFGAYSVIGNNSHVGDFCIVNTGAILEHDSSLGDFSHLCPGVVTGGRVKIGSRTTIGLNASIRDGVTIGNNCVIGMASNVLNDVPDNTIGWGNPFRAYENRPA